jgi:hypothetical protein
MTTNEHLTLTLSALALVVSSLSFLGNHALVMPRLKVAVYSGQGSQHCYESSKPLDLSRHWGATPSATNMRLLVELCRNGLMAA